MSEGPLDPVSALETTQGQRMGTAKCRCALKEKADFPALPWGRGGGGGGWLSQHLSSVSPTSS